jgi:hypothetical protein
MVANKHYFPVKEKFSLVFKKIESGFRKIIFQTFICLFAIRKVGQRKTLSSQRKIWLGFQESVFL